MVLCYERLGHARYTEQRNRMGNILPVAILKWLRSCRNGGNAKKVEDGTCAIKVKMVSFNVHATNRTKKKQGFLRSQETI